MKKWLSFLLGAVLACTTPTENESTALRPNKHEAPTAPCLVSGATWQNFSFPSQTDTFTVAFDVTPNSAGTDAQIGLSKGPANSYSKLATIVKFTTANKILVRNGGVFTSDVVTSYAASTKYHFRLVVNIPTHTYDAFVQPDGGSEVQIADNYAFRTEQATLTSLDRLGFKDEVGSVTVCAPEILNTEPEPPPPPAFENGCPTSGYARLVNVSTASQLTAALANDMAGDQIRLAPGTYAITGALVINQNITLCGPRTAIIDGNNTAGTWIDVQSTAWLRGFRITETAKGIYQTAGSPDSIVVDSLKIDNVRTEGIQFAQSGNGHEVKYTHIVGTGLNIPAAGEGIYIGDGTDPSQLVTGVYLHHNILENISAEGIELKAGSGGATIVFNKITNAGSANLVGSRGSVQVRSNGNTVTDNEVTTFAGNAAYNTGTGVGDLTQANNNTYRRNKASNAAGGAVFQVESGHTGNVFYCDNIPVPPVVMGVSCTP